MFIWPTRAVKVGATHFSPGSAAKLFWPTLVAVPGMLWTVSPTAIILATRSPLLFLQMSCEWDFWWPQKKERKWGQVRGSLWPDDTDTSFCDYKMPRSQMICDCVLKLGPRGRGTDVLELFFQPQYRRRLPYEGDFSDQTFYVSNRSTSGTLKVCTIYCTTCTHVLCKMYHNVVRTYNSVTSSGLLGCQATSTWALRDVCRGFAERCGNAAVS